MSHKKGDTKTVVNRMVDARPCNVFVVLRRVRNSRTVIIIIIKLLAITLLILNPFKKILLLADSLGDLQQSEY